MTESRAKTGIKRCLKCKKEFKPNSNNQLKCFECKPRNFSGPIIPPRDPIEKMLDSMEFERARERSREGWL